MAAAVGRAPGAHASAAGGRCARRGRRAATRAGEGPVGCPREDGGVGVGRRMGLAGAAVWAVAAGAPRPGVARAEDTAAAAAAAASGTRPGSGGTEHYDVKDQFRITVPAGWVRGEGVAPGQMGVQASPGSRRRVIVFADPARAAEANCTVTLTDLSADYTGIGSFGGAYEVAATLVGGLDQPDQGQRAKLLGYGNSGDGFVWCEYSLIPVEVVARSGITKPPPPGVVPRHVLSLLATQRVGQWYNRLYSVNVTGSEASFAKDALRFRAILDSFALGDGLDA